MGPDNDALQGRDEKAPEYRGSHFQLQCLFLLSIPIIFDQMVLEATEATGNRRRSYRKIPFEARIELVELILKEKLTISKAALELKIALSTAKLIFKRYRETGTFFLRREERSRLNKRSRRSKKEEKMLPRKIEEPSIENVLPQQDTPLELPTQSQELTAYPLAFYYYHLSLPLESLLFWSTY